MPAKPAAAPARAAAAATTAPAAPQQQGFATSGTVDVAALEGHLLFYSYVGGFTPTRDDAATYDLVCGNAGRIDRAAAAVWSTEPGPRGASTSVERGRCPANLPTGPGKSPDVCDDGVSRPRDGSLGVFCESEASIVFTTLVEELRTAVNSRKGNHSGHPELARASARPAFDRWAT